MKSTRIVVQCEIVTPLFSYGADGETPEIRMPSLKGIIRFWWRAANSYLGMEQLKLRESLIFGGINKNSEKKDKNEIGKSKIQMRLINGNNKLNTCCL